MPSVVQTAVVAGDSATIAVTGFGSNVVAGNTVVVGWADVSNTGSPADIGVAVAKASGTASIGVFTSAISKVDGATSLTPEDYIWYATVSGGGSLSIQVTWTSSNFSSRLGLLETNGYSTTTRTATGTGLASGQPLDINTATTVSFTASNELLVAAAACYSANESGKPGWTLLGNGANNGIYYSTSGVTSPTNFPIHIDGGFNTPDWAIAGVVFDPILAGGFIESGPKRQYRRESVRMR